ncbi:MULTISPECIES: DUF6474 family protein [unclassified Corynebacterium]|uniref:DUF6474 family protein n=1 Tax=unclassified Corynebacterium TaxID=2624378 RepID=UPI001C47421A|nr:MULTISPECIES: DUF6474 family protein [unclassified Corynebacterium]MBV7282220.1 hypothetical protein [Corynebacterium sp. TAE3-ERU30]MBV7302439.1 hypothetical protein [Corynebacterium sp. TAE3-ERU2]
MGLFRTIRKARLKSKAEIKAAKARAKKEAKEAAKLEYKRDKLLAKQEKNLLKADRKGMKNKRKHERKRAQQELDKLKAGKFNKKNAQRYAGFARTLAPLLLPLVYRGITWAKEQRIQQRSRKLGVAPEQLAQFNGHGAAVKARIAGISANVEKSSLPHGFVMDVEDRLKELDAAVDNAEFMTVEQRRRSHASINRDLDQIMHEVNSKLKS